MKKKFVILLILPLMLWVDHALAASYVNLPVPFTSEMPLGIAVNPWYNGCEEASVVMVDQFYKGTKALSKTVAAKEMQRIFDWEDKTFGYNTDTDAAETARIINEAMSFKAIVERHPTLDEIKAELDAGRPVITPIDGVLFYGKKYGLGYHMIVVKGYNDIDQVFIVNDNGNSSRGRDFEVPYENIMAALNDFDNTTKKLSGVPTAIFTGPKKEYVNVKSPHMPEESALITTTTIQLQEVATLNRVTLWQKIVLLLKSLFTV